MGKKVFIEPWDGKAPVEGLTGVAPAPTQAPTTAPEPVKAAAPEVAPATPATKFELSLADLQAFAAVLLVRRLREMREEEK